MNLLIQIRNGQAYEHPIFEDNFQQAFPSIDINNLPPEFARFDRVPPPNPGVYEAVEGPIYQWVGNIVKDVWAIRPMTDAERAAKNEELTQGAYNIRDFFKTIAQQKIDESTTDAERQAWSEYLIQLEAYVVTDPVKPNVPIPPRINADGTLLTTTAPGSAPSVTG